MIYIAAPFFTPKQVAFVESIEKALDNERIKYYSPRSEGVLMDLSETARRKTKKDIYERNVQMIKECNYMVAIIDDRDIGTIWEMGYATAYGIPVTTISNQDYGLNVMLAESVQAHVLDIDCLMKAILNPEYRGELTEMKGIY